MTGRYLVKGGCVLTLGARSGNQPEADVLIEDGRIAEIGPRLRARDAEVVDAAGAVVMPGFVDAHRHAWTSLFRNAGAGQDLASLGEHHQPDDVYAAVLVGLLGAVEAGITTVVDFSDVQADGSYTEAVLQAHTEAGLRTVLVHAPPAWVSGPVEDGGLRALVSGRGVQAGPLTTIAAGPRAGLRDADAVARQWAGARELGLRVHVHAGTDPGDRGGVAALGALGLLGGDVTLVHCTALDDADFDAVAAHGAHVVLTPSTEMASGLGAAPLQQLIDRGVRPGLGVDDEALAPGDVFAQMRMAQSVQHATLFDLKLAGKGGVPNLLGTRDVIRYGTVDGARAAGVADVTGSLEVGKQADLIVLRTDQANISPVNDPIGAVVWGMDASNVGWVFVAGRPLVRDGALTADVERARTLAVRARDRVAAAAGRLADVPGGAR